MAKRKTFPRFKKKIDLDELSYDAYGWLMLSTILCLAIIISFAPYFKVNILITCLLQLPIYLYVRDKLPAPIHANGLNPCYVLTTLHYLAMFVLSRFLSLHLGDVATFLLTSILCVFSCYVFSAVSTGKLFLGKRKEQGKYADIIRYIKDNPKCSVIKEYKEILINIDPVAAIIFQSIFIDDDTWDIAMEASDIWERKQLDKEIYAIYKTLKVLLHNK